MNTRITPVRSFSDPRVGINRIQGFDSRYYDQLDRIGVNIDNRFVRKLRSAMDALQSDVTIPSIGTPVQFLQNWLPGFIFVITNARKIDDIIGMQMSGQWEDEQVVQGIMELTGTSEPYGDLTNVPYANWNTNFGYRSVVRFEEGLQVSTLEEARASRMRVDSASAKREGAALALEIVRNYTGFYGYNAGNNNTYGFLNDPGLPAYTNVPNGASGSPLWANKTFLEICKDIRTAISTLRNQSGDNVDPTSVNITMAVATTSVDYLSTIGEFGISVMAWLNTAFPRVRVVSAPELNAANASANVFYLFAEQITDGSTDDGRVFIQPVQTKFQMLGVKQSEKGYSEDYSNATAGAWCKRPWGVVRRSGI